MTEILPSTAERASHWDDVYSSRGASGVSWFQPAPRVSLALIDVLSVARGAAIIDIGGGASLFVDSLLGKGYSDLTVLDVSEAGLNAARKRLGLDAPVTWLHEDLLSWQPQRRFDLWHDRAVFHFLNDPADRDAYMMTLQMAIAPHGAVIIATFAPHGPEHCSGLPVTRYSPEQLAGALGPDFDVVATQGEEHTTPAGAVQAFTWVAGRRRS